MAGWRLFKKRPETRRHPEDELLVEILQKLRPQPAPVPTGPSSSGSGSGSGSGTGVPIASTHRRRAASINSHRSRNSVRSSRSSLSSRQNRPQSSSAVIAKRRSTRLAQPIGAERRCFACARLFSGNHCGNCDTNYDEIAPVEPQPLDLSLAFDLATMNDSSLLEQIVCETFSSADAAVACFCENSTLSLEKIDMLYEILATPTSTAPMRAILQGAQTVLLNRTFRALTHTELLYLLIVLQCPALAQCSMFTKITGPLQKLARYSSLRSRARVVLEISMGLLSNMTSDLRLVTVGHLGKMDTQQFESFVDLINSYIGHRLMFHYHYKAPKRRANVKARNEIKVHWYADDWRIAAAAKVLELCFEASNLHNKLPISHFYNMVADNIELGADYDAWQAQLKRRDNFTTTELWNSDPAILNKFSFCQYPFLLTITSKASVFKHSLHRKVREHELQAHKCFSTGSGSGPLINRPSSSASSAYSVQHAQATNSANSAVHAAWSLASQPHAQNANLQMVIRRDYLLQDSMALLLSHNATDIKKPLRIEFVNEPGIDAGGLCKEWMHLLFNELTAPKLGLFVRDEESAFNWFGTQNENLDYYSTLGIALGVAFNNGMMIDSGLPDLAYKLLLDTPYSMDDVGQVWPTVTRSLNAILDYPDDEENLEDVFGLSFTAPNGQPLCPDGENISVTHENRELYVDQMVKFMTSPSEQFLRFKAGFMRACDTAALPIFAATEVEALLRGERKPIDLVALRNNTRYLHWGTPHDVAKEPVVIWFWDFFKSLSAEKQALLLVFVTATPRVPATGISTLQFRISCLGPDSDRLPVAHTCFNQLGLYRYRSRQKLYKKLTMAITECQSFGIK